MYNSPIPSLNIEFIFYKIYELFTGGVSADGLRGIYEKFVDFSVNLMPFSVAFSLLLIVGIVYCYTRFEEIEHEMIHAGGGDHHHGGDNHHGVEDTPNKRWARIVNHLNSENESDWRLAVLEADLILEEMLNSMGYQGDTIAERLKGIERSDFLTIDDAWEGHKIRNKIAHEGGDFRLTNREARRIVSLFERVFKEFHFI